MYRNRKFNKNGRTKSTDLDTIGENSTIKIRVGCNQMVEIIKILAIVGICVFFKLFF